MLKQLNNGLVMPLAEWPEENTDGLTVVMTNAYSTERVGIVVGHHKRFATLAFRVGTRGVRLAEGNAERFWVLLRDEEGEIVQQNMRRVIPGDVTEARMAKWEDKQDGGDGDDTP